MRVEVNVQDNFFWLSQSAVTQADKVPCPISTPTWESWFHQWLEALQSDLPPAESYELSLRLTDDGEIQEFNAQYRQKNQPTDVLAFAALEVDSPQIPDHKESSTPLYLGDLVISIDTACRQAREQEHSLQTELAWLTTHGLLHLLGWDHPDEESLKEMLNQQEILIQMVDLSSL